MPVTPYDAAKDLLDRADGLLALDVSPASSLVRTDLRRMAWAMGVASLDTYMHWLIRGVALSGSVPKELGKVQVNFRDVVEMANKSLDARREGVADRPNVRARNILNDVLLTKTFQSADSIKTGLNMVGVTDVWTKLSAAMKPTE